MRLLSLAALLTFTLSGCATQSANQANEAAAPTPNVVLAEPEQAEFRYEIEIARINQLLSDESLSDEELAFAYYRRGALFDALGLRTLSRMDFMRAIEIKPRLADAYNYLGIQYTELGEFDFAFEALDSALELDPEHPYALLNRGIAEYYDNRIKFAVNDFQQHLKNDPSDPYRVIWLFLAQYRESPNEALNALASNKQAIDEDDWANRIIELYLGELSEVEFLQQLTTQLRGDETLAERLCEAYFYLGKYSQRQQQWSKAANYFKLALTTNVHEFVEHRYADIELEQTRKQLQ